jgi:hypothetical protein
MDGNNASSAASFSCLLSSLVRRLFLSFTGFCDGSLIASYDQFLAMFTLI